MGENRDQGKGFELEVVFGENIVWKRRKTRSKKEKRRRKVGETKEVGGSKVNNRGLDFESGVGGEKKRREKGNMEEYEK